MQLSDPRYPADAMQAGVWKAITESPYLINLFPDGVPAYDMVPRDKPDDYLTIDEGQYIDDSNACDPDNYEAFITVHVWSRAYPTSKSQQMTAAVRHALLNQLAVVGWQITVSEFRSVTHMRDPDGITKHAVVVFRYLLQPKAGEI